MTEARSSSSASEAAVRDSEERFRAFVTASSDVVYRMSPDWSEMRELDGQGFLVDTQEPTEIWMETYIHPADRTSVRAAIDEAIRSRSMFQLEHRVIAADGSLRWTLSRAVPILDGDGRIKEWLGAASDVTSRHEAEELYRLLFESIDEGFCVVEVMFDETGRPCDYRFLQVNPAFERQTDLKDAVGKSMVALHPTHEQFWYDAYGRVARTGESERFEHEAAALGRWYDVYAFRVGKPDEHRVAVLFNDITTRKRADAVLQESETRLKLLLSELQHRVRNTLAVIRSIVRRTAITSESVEDFEQHLDGRLAAFARTQTYVTRDPDGGVDLELIIRDELVAHAADGGRSIDIKGPPVRLSLDQAETIGLAVHELTTNAVKHGALASDGHKVDVEWTVDGRGDKRTLRFSWRETLSGRTLTPPQRAGFGTELLERVLEYELDAETSIDFRPGGLSYRADIPLPPPPVPVKP